MSKIPPVLKAMTPFPHSVDIDSDLVTAQVMMGEHGIHHLPVTEAGKLAGLLSESDIRAAGSVAGATGATDVSAIRVRDVCTTPPFVVDADDPLDGVVLQMAEEHYSTAVVTRNDKLVGIVTEVDVCRYLGELLRSGRPERGASA